MRKLAKIVKLDSVIPHPNADMLDISKWGGWQSITKRNEFKSGDLVVACEIDSWIPSTIAPFLSKGKEPRIYNGVLGERLRTVKLRGQISQGLLLPIEKLDDGCIRLITSNMEQTGGRFTFTIDADLDQFLNIQKWERAIPAQLAGIMKGSFPSWIRKTDQERCCDENTLLETDIGIRTIKEVCDVKYSGKVKSYNHLTKEVEYKRILNWSIGIKKPDDWLILKLKSGKEIVVTKNHKIFLTPENCYREAQHIKIGDIVNILLGAKNAI